MGPSHYMVKIPGSCMSSVDSLHLHIKKRAGGTYLDRYIYTHINKGGGAEFN